MEIRVPLVIRQIPPKGYHVFVEGRISGKPVLFLIDTGASKSVVDEGFVKSHFGNRKLIDTDHHTTGLGANIPNSRFIRLHRVKIGDFRAGGWQFAVLDLQVVNGAYDQAGIRHVQAILGGDILKKFKSILDYGRREIVFS